MLDYTIARIYQHSYEADDLKEPKPDTVIVRPVSPPEKTIGGIVDPRVQSLQGSQALLYRVVTAGPYTKTEGVLEVHPGDVVILRNAHLDPIHWRMDWFTIKADHILMVVERAKP